MKNSIIASFLAFTLVFAGCSNTENLQGKFTTTRPPALLVNNGTLVTETSTISYGTDVAIGSFTLESSTGTISVSTISFVISQTGLNGFIYGQSSAYKMYPVVGGAVDTTRPMATSVSLTNDGTTGLGHDVLSFIVNDPDLGLGFSLQVSGIQEYAIVGEVVDDGVLNTNMISISSSSANHGTLDMWTWSAYPKILTGGTFRRSGVIGQSNSKLS